MDTDSLVGVDAGGGGVGMDGSMVSGVDVGVGVGDVASGDRGMGVAVTVGGAEADRLSVGVGRGVAEGTNGQQLPLPMVGVVDGEIEGVIGGRIVVGKEEVAGEGDEEGAAVVVGPALPVPMGDAVKVEKGGTDEGVIAGLARGVCSGVVPGLGVVAGDTLALMLVGVHVGVTVLVGVGVPGGTGGHVPPGGSTTSSGCERWASTAAGGSPRATYPLPVQ